MNIVAVIVMATVLAAPVHANNNCDYLESQLIKAVAKQHKVTVFQARTLLVTQPQMVADYANANVRFWLRNYIHHCVK